MHGVTLSSGVSCDPGVLQKVAFCAPNGEGSGGELLGRVTAGSLPRVAAPLSSPPHNSGRPDQTTTKTGY